MRPELLVLIIAASLSLADVEIQPNNRQKINLLSMDIESNITLRSITTTVTCRLENAASAFQPAFLQTFLKMLLPSTTYITKLTMELDNGDVYQAVVEDTEQSKYRYNVLEDVTSKRLTIEEIITETKTLIDTEGDTTVTFRYRQLLVGDHDHVIAVQWKELQTLLQSQVSPNVRVNIIEKRPFFVDISSKPLKMLRADVSYAIDNESCSIRFNFLRLSEDFFIENDQLIETNSVAKSDSQLEFGKVVNITIQPRKVGSRTQPDFFHSNGLVYLLGFLLFLFLICQCL